MCQVWLRPPFRCLRVFIVWPRPPDHADAAQGRGAAAVRLSATDAADDVYASACFDVPQMMLQPQAGSPDADNNLKMQKATRPPPNRDLFSFESVYFVSEPPLRN